ncbi:MAG TPA: DegT/DnrJ/EryC1/StrS family aminotransferase, partial [Fibrobacteria bacterium]|nr:DegT/DnrJ/EryC1/StrS family aminotransferase [Fibrobacteria bacterium]
MNPTPVSVTPPSVDEFLSRFAGQDGKLFPYMHNSMSEFVPGKTSIFYSGPYWGTEEVQAAVGALLFGQWLAAGEAVRKFETEFAKRLGQRHALMVNSGSSANLALVSAARQHFKWVDGDEIIASVVGFPTTTAPVVQAGLKCVFVDIEMDSLN